MLYTWKVRLLKHPRLNLLWRWYQAKRGRPVGDYGHLPGLIRQYVKGKSFADIGCMWGVNGEYSFVAEEAGATEVKAVDVWGPTPEFEEKKRARQSNVEFILGDAVDVRTIEQVGQVDVVFCAGVLYHHPSPYDLLVALRKMCKERLILRTSTIPEVRGLPNAAVFWPMLREKDRALWNLKTLGVRRQEGITGAFAPDQGYGNWFWGLTPSCLASLLRMAGFEPERQLTEAFVQNFVCKAVATPMEHKLPTEHEARAMALNISQAGIAQPA